MNTQSNYAAASKGLILIMIAVVFWAILPLALKVSLQKLDGVTITWFRFAVALVVTLAIQYYNGALQQFSGLNRRDWTLLSIAGLFLVADYVGFVISLNYISASAAQVFSQVTPLFLAIGGIVFFKERMSQVQVICFVLLFVGLMLFFNDSLTMALDSEDKIWLGGLIAMGASLLWSIYALLQKQLSHKLSPSNILLFTYALAIFLLFPLSDMNTFGTLDQSDWGFLLFCAFNTLIAYGAFAESLRYLNATQGGTILATTPLLTIAATFVASLIWPAFVTADQISTVGWAGIALVIFSVISFNLIQKRQVKVAEA